MDGEGLRVRGLPLGWEWCVSAVSDSLVSSVLRAARVPKCRSQGSELWIRPVLISGYWTATTGPTTRPIGRDAVRDTQLTGIDGRPHRHRSAQDRDPPAPRTAVPRADEATDKDKIADYSVQIRS